MFNMQELYYCTRFNKLCALKNRIHEFIHYYGVTDHH